MTTAAAASLLLGRGPAAAFHHRGFASSSSSPMNGAGSSKGSSSREAGSRLDKDDGKDEDDSASTATTVKVDSSRSSSSKGDERDIRHPSMETEKDVAGALRGVQELYRAGQYQEALEASLAMRDWLERELGEDHPVYASCLNNIALMHKMLDDCEEAVHWYSQALHK